MKRKALSKTMLTLLLTSMLTLAFNIQPVNATSTIISVVKTRILEPGDDLIHGFVYYEGYLWASTRTSPCRILKINPETLDYERIILDAGLNDGEDLIAAGGSIWVILYTSPSKIIRVDPETLTWEIAVAFQSNELSNGGSLEYAFGYLWAGGSDGRIAKIDLSNLTYVIYSYSIVAGYTYTAELTRGGGYLWGSCPHYSWWQGWYADTIVRINPSNPADYNSVYISTLMCDDMAYMDGYLYTGGETYPSYVYKISDSLTYSSVEASDTPCYAIFAFQSSIWGAYVGSPGKIVELDSNLNVKGTYQLPLGFNNANEIAFDTAGNMYVTCWESPAKIIKLSLTPSPNVADSFRFPLDGAWTISRGFGKWYDDFQGYHLGEDVMRDFEDPVYAPANGVVKWNENVSKYGYVIVIEHELLDETFVCSVLGHLKKEWRITVGYNVTKGQIVGYLSNLPEENGGYNFIHLHFGIRKGRYTTEPDRDGKWRYRGYGPADIVDLWYPPSDFINYYNLKKTTTLPKQIGLTVKVTSDKTSYNLSEEIKFETIVTNPTKTTGINITAYNVSVTINSPAEIQLKTPQTYYQLGDIRPDESKILNFNATATKAGNNIVIEVKAAGEDHLLETPISGSKKYIFFIFDPATPKPQWSFAIITDLHIGYGYPDYDGFGPRYDENKGWNDALVEGEDYHITHLLEASVRRIIGLIVAYNIKFVVVLGDLSDSAEESEFMKARQVLNLLNDPDKDGNTSDGIPYIPLLGNHDIRPYTQNKEGFNPDTSRPPWLWSKPATDQGGCGDELFKKVFWDENPVNGELVETKLKEFVKQEPIWRADMGRFLYYQNYFFTFGDSENKLNFIALDLEHRGPQAGFITDFPEQTRKFLLDHLQTHKDERFIILSHEPLKGEGGFIYSQDVAWLLMTNARFPAINFAGHTHRNRDTWESIGLIPAYRVVETEAVSQIQLKFMWREISTHSGESIRIVNLRDGEVDYSTKLMPILGIDLLWPSPFFTTSGFASYPEPNNPIVFTAHTANLYGFETSFQWDLGDGNSAQGLTIEHAYSQDGDYNVTLTVVTKNLLTGNETIQTSAGVIRVRYKHLISSLPPNLNATSLLTGEDLTKVPKNTYEPIIITKSGLEGETPIGVMEVLFEESSGNIDLSNLVADVDLQRRKSIIYMSSWPAEVEDYKRLFIPSSGSGSVYICLNATSLDEVKLGNADLIFNLGETINNITVTATYYDGKEYYLVYGNLTNFGGGEIFHNIAITNITSSKTVVGQGFSLHINVTIQNPGTFNENFNITLCANTTVIRSQNITLTSGSSTTIVLTWNTTGFPYGNYTLSAVADTVPYENDIADNTVVDGTVLVSIPGDVNGDKKVDTSDLSDLSESYGSLPTLPEWNPNRDINGDGKTDVLDLFALSKNYGTFTSHAENEPFKANHAWAFIFALSTAIMIAPKFRKNNKHHTTQHLYT